jgi:F0F1-type ATP synthase epsilon subunit/predicted Zn-dependent protease with MMP-like domain
MENIEENQVTAGAAKADPMPASGIPVEDLGGPTPENYKPDDDSAKLKDPAATLAQVKDIVNAKAGKAESVEPEGDVIEEEPKAEATDEVVAEEEDSKEEVVAEEETTEEEVIEEEEVIDIDADVKALLEGEELSEEFQDKARTIFEGAIRSKVADIKEELQESYAVALVEELDEIKKGLTERVDSYLEYVCDEWFQENALQVEAGLKTEMTESFLDGMKSLFEEHYVTIPEEKYDVLNSMVDKLDEMEGKLNEQIDRNVALNRRLAESNADGIFTAVSEGLADTQKEKLATLAENVEFESDTDYREKLETLKESYFPSKASAPKNTSENLSEEVSTDEVISEETTPRMQAYLNVLSRAVNK